MKSREPLGCLWRGQRQAVQRVLRSEAYLAALRHRLAVQGARDDSDPELERCLGPRPAGRYLVQAARYLRDEGFSLIDSS